MILRIDGTWVQKRQLVYVDGQPVPMRPKIFRAVCAMAARPGEWLTQIEMGIDYRENLPALIYCIRKETPIVIENNQAGGYRIAGSVTIATNVIQV